VSSGRTFLISVQCFLNNVGTRTVAIMIEQINNQTKEAIGIGFRRIKMGKALHHFFISAQVVFNEFVPIKLSTSVKRHSAEKRIQVSRSVVFSEMKNFFPKILKPVVVFRSIAIFFNFFYRNVVNETQIINNVQFAPKQFCRCSPTNTLDSKRSRFLILAILIARRATENVCPSIVVCIYCGECR